MTDSSRLLGVVLCGGMSARMGRDKSQLLHTDGTSFLQHAAERIGQVCDAAAVSCREPMATNHQLIPDPVADRGPAVGIAASLRFASQHGFAACMFTPVDMPNLTSKDLLEIKQVWQPTNCLTVAQAEQLQPLVGIYPVALLENVDRLAASDQRSLVNWLKSQSYVAVTLTETACLNVNAPEDWTDGT